MKKGLTAFLIVLLLLFISAHRLAYVQAMMNPEPLTVEPDELLEVASFRDQGYTRTLARWLETASYAPAEVTTVPLSLILNPQLTPFADPAPAVGVSALLEEGDAATFIVDVAFASLIEIAIDFYLPNVFYTVPSVRLEIDGELLYSEMAALKLPVEWAISPLPEAQRYNRYGNELLPTSTAVQQWTTGWFEDSTRQHGGNYQFLIPAGTHEITVTAIDLPIAIGSLYYSGKAPTLTYAEYRLANQANVDEAAGELITIEGQDFVRKNDLEVKSSYYKESAMTPYSYRNSVLNQLDGASMTRGGTAVTYEFSVAKNGWYSLSLKALKNTYLGVVSGKEIEIDGEVPFSELALTTFGSSRSWQNVTVGNATFDYQIYLTAGDHTLSIRSTTAHYTANIDRLNAIMDDINRISLTVQTITGGNTDDALDWNILKYLPDLKERLMAYAAELEAMYDALNEFDVSQPSAPELSTLNVAAKQLLRVAKNPNKIGSKLNEFSEGSGSAYQLIGAAIQAMLNQPLSVDKIYFHQDVALPKPNGSFFTKLWHGVKAFFYSFFDTRYNDIGIDEGTLEVWVSQSSLYLDIIQSMIDLEFTQETGIPVKASILQNTSKIILSNATNDNPDVVLSIDSWIPYAYALRGMLEDLSEYEDFDLLASEQIANNFTTLIHEQGVYGMPETQSVFLMFYRKDIFDYLNLSVPDTWDDVISILPILQSHRLNFFHPLGGDSAYKGYGFTTPFIYQFGGEVYSENGIASTLRDEATIEAVQFMTDLFTVYNLPLQVSSFFEHFRSGDMPIGIASMDLYLQLKYAAPELAGQWDVAPIPGIYSDTTGRVERYASSYGKTAILFSNSEMKAEGWELIKWWTSAETQTKYHQIVKTSLGERYLQIPANMVALQNSVWDEAIKGHLVNQALWGRMPAVTPGSYIVEREISNIWNKVVIDRENVMVAINEAIPRITRELNRKFSEFGYQTSVSPDGKVFVVPMQSNINQWLPGGGYEHEDDPA